MHDEQEITANSEATIVNGLARYPFFSANAAGTLLPYLERAQYNCGDLLWQEGDENSYIAFILSGRFEEKKSTTFSDKQIVIGVYAAGSLIGESSLVENSGRPFSANCIEPGLLLTLSRDQFERLQRQHEQVAFQLMSGAAQTLALRLNKAFDRLVAIF